MNPAIRERLDSVQQVLGSYKALAREEFETSRSWLASVLVGGPLEARYREAARRDTQNDTPAMVRDWFAQLPVGLADLVVVIWPDLGSGIVVPWGAFVAAYDDLWYPSSDDVWVHGASNEWLLELSHEEVFRFLMQVKAASP